MIMGYTLMAVLVALVSVLIPSVLNGIYAGKGAMKKHIFWGSILACVYGPFWLLISWGDSQGFYAPLPYFFSLFVGLVMASIAGHFIQSDEGEHKLPSTFFAVIVALAITFVFLGSTDMWGNAKEKAKLIGEVTVINDLNQVMLPADNAHVCLVDDEMAKVSANAALSKFKVDGGAVAGSRYKIGEPTKQLINGQLWWIFPVEFQGWLKWKQNNEVPGYLRISAEDPFMEAETVQTNRKGEKIAMKYLKSACFEYEAERHLRNNGYMHKILMDWTFEPDDQWNPYYTVTVAERVFGYKGYKAVGLVTLNVQTGEVKHYGLNEVPAWVDRVIPLDIIDHNMKKWGLYNIEGWWYTLWHDDKSQAPTKGWFLTYDPKNGAQWFSGFTSTNSADQALTGFTLINARTMKTSFFKANGVTEEKSYDAAKSLWSNFADYAPAEMVPYNIDGELTYVIPMAYKGQFKGVTLVSISNLALAAKGSTFKDALDNYRSKRSESGANRYAPAGGELKQLRIAGKIDRVGLPLSKEGRLIIPFTLVGEEKRFQANDAKSPKAVFLQSGDKVEISFPETNEAIINVTELEVMAVILSDKNLNQARLLENQSRTKAESDRVSKEEKREKLLGSDRLKSVDPEALERFLKEQKK